MRSVYIMNDIKSSIFLNPLLETIKPSGDDFPLRRFDKQIR